MTEHKHKQMMGREYFHIFGESCKSRIILFTLSISVRFHKNEKKKKKKEGARGGGANAEFQKEDNSAFIERWYNFTENKMHVSVCTETNTG